MRSVWSKVDPKCDMAGVLIRRRKETEIDMNTQGEDHMKVETEMGMRHPQAYECYGLLATTTSNKRPGEILTRSLHKESGSACLHLDFGLPASITVREYISVILTFQVCGIC